MNQDFRVFSTAEDLANAAAGLLKDIASAAVAAYGCSAIALSGGRTPKLLFEALGQSPNGMPWESTALFWSDERFVPANHADSNYRLAKETLLDRLPIKPGSVYPVDTGLASAAAAAAAYETNLRKVFSSARQKVGWPCFDCILLGMGTDGHTASLFPGDRAVDERSSWTAVGQAPDHSLRITLTLPVLNSARHVLFLVTGQEKADMVAAIAGGTAKNLPAAMVTSENVIWLLDSTAASKL